MDAQYLKDTVGDALIEALNEVIEKTPTDPIEYLGLMLLKYLENQDDSPNKRRSRVEKQVSRKTELREKCIDVVNETSQAPAETEATSDDMAPKSDSVILKAEVSSVPQNAVVDPDSKITGDEGGIVEPDSKITRDEGGIVEPDSKITGDEGGIVDPYSKITRDEGGIVDPDSKITRGEGGIVEPDSKITRDEGGIVEPDSKITRDEGGIVDPDSKITRDGRGIVDPDIEITRDEGSNAAPEKNQETVEPESNKDKEDTNQADGVTNVTDSNQPNGNEEKDEIIEETNEKTDILSAEHSDKLGTEGGYAEGDKDKVETVEKIEEERLEETVNEEPVVEDSAETREDESPPEDSKE